MREAELMIGDFVNLSDNDKDKIYCKVLDLHTDELYVIQQNEVACDVVGYDMIRPIKLTKKIFKKNGFKDIDKLGVEKCVGYNIYFKNGDGWCFNEQCFSLHYVHQLQHALRLCGLDELATNFKV